MKNQVSIFKRAAGLLLVSAVMMGSLTACISPLDMIDMASTPPPAGSPTPDPSPESTPGRMTHSTQGVAFEVPADWTQAEEMDFFYTIDQRQVYGLNGVSALGSYTPQEFFDELLSYYSGQFDVFDAPETLTFWQSSDGVDCYTANLTGVYESILYCTKLVIVPQKNLVLTFCGQVQVDYKDPSHVWLVLNDLCDSLTFEIGSQDYISGNTFLCENDGSQLCLRDDNSFRYYQSADDHENMYYEGVYEVYYGQAAMDKVASMTEYGLTMEELERVLTTNMNGYVPGGSSPLDFMYATGELEDTRTRYSVCLDTFYAVILDNQRLVFSPDNVLEDGNSVLYLGYYLPELEMADLTNANAASYTQWTFQEKTAEGDGSQENVDF